MPTSATWQKPDPLRILAEASSSLLSVPELSAVLPKIVDMASEIIQAEAYAVWRAKDAHEWKILAARGLSPEYLRGTVVSHGPNPLHDEPLVVEDVQSHSFGAMRREYYRTEGIISMMVVPLKIGGRPEGTITFYWKSAHVASPDDLSYAVALANLASAAINTADLYDQKSREQQRTRFLAEASTLLASSLDYDATLKQVARMVVPTIADWCSVRIIENGQISRTAVAHSDPAKLAFADEYAKAYPDEIRADRGLGKVLATGHSELYPVITDEMLVEGARDERHLALMRELGMSSVLMAPLNARGRSIGAITLIAAESGKHFTPEDLRLAEDLAVRAAIAVDNAQLHRALQESESRFRNIIVQSPVSTVLLDSTGRLVEANEAFNRLFGATLAEAPPDYSVLSDPQLNEAGVLPLVREAFEQGNIVKLPPVRYDAARTSTSGRGNLLWAEALLYPIRDEFGRVERVVMQHADVTDRIHAEQEKLERQEALRRTEKLAAAGRLAASVAHEINNPLEAVTNLLFLVKSEPGLPPDALKYAKMMEEELARVAHVAKQTLGFYRDNVEPEPIDLCALVSEVLWLYQKKARERAVTLNGPGAAMITVHVRAGEMKQVLSNLVSNALDACAEGGAISVVLERQPEAVKITVQDDGIGICPEHLDRVFEPFFTTKKDIGTGLGLWVSREIVERHGGTISVESRTGRVNGSRFTVTIPV